MPDIQTKDSTLLFELKPLKAALSTCLKTVETKTTIPVLTHLLIECAADEGAQTKLTATNMDQWITVSAPTARSSAVADAGFARAVPAKLLNDWVARQPDGCQIKLAFDAEKNVIKASAGRSRTTLSTLPAADFPQAQSFDSQFDPVLSEVLFAPGELNELLGPCRPAISTEETRYYLNGIFLTDDEQMLAAVATDGHRLVRNHHPHEYPETDEDGAPIGAPKVIVPRTAVTTLIDLDGKTPFDSLRLRTSERLAEATVEIDGNAQTVFRTKLIDGTFPEYQRVIPQDNKRSAIIDRSELLAAFERVSLAGDGKERGVRCRFTNDRLLLTFISNSAKAEEEIDLAESFVDPITNGEPFEIGFNAVYLTQLLGTLNSHFINWSMGNSASPTVLTPVPADGDGKPSDPANSPLIVIMPMRV